MLARIEGNAELAGTVYWEKIISAIPPELLMNNSFSEFETFGTFTALTDPSRYRLREWHSFRLGAQFYNPETICDRDFEWLYKDFQAISFEKNQFVREDHQNLFDNPEFQQKLSARKMLEVAQEAFEDGYVETWQGGQN
jgi:hypothetical protein